ncbi:MAG: hypothetical protein ACYTEQ_25685, partial [Planctomycetota bacterium]
DDPQALLRSLLAEVLVDAQEAGGLQNFLAPPQQPAQPVLNPWQKLGMTSSPQAAARIRDEASGGAFTDFANQQAEYEQRVNLFNAVMGQFGDESGARPFGELRTVALEDGTPVLQEFIRQPDGSFRPGKIFSETPHSYKIGPTAGGIAGTNRYTLESEFAPKPGQGGGGQGLGPGEGLQPRPAGPAVQQRMGIASLFDQVGQVAEAARIVNEQSVRGERGETGAILKEFAAENLGKIGQTKVAHDVEFSGLIASIDLLAQSAARAIESGRLSDQDILFKLKQIGTAASATTPEGFKSFKRRLRQLKRQMIINMKQQAALQPEVFSEPGELMAVMTMPLPSIAEPKIERTDEELLEALESGKDLTSQELDRVEGLLNAAEQQ